MENKPTEQTPEQVAEQKARERAEKKQQRVNDKYASALRDQRNNGMDVHCNYEAIIEGLRFDLECAAEDKGALEIKVADLEAKVDELQGKLDAINSVKPDEPAPAVAGGSPKSDQTADAGETAEGQAEEAGSGAQ